MSSIAYLLATSHPCLDTLWWYLYTEGAMLIEMGRAIEFA